ncbi:hypothetical protein GCK32_000846, partial [Trichostrongylus colubriformis]
MTSNELSLVFDLIKKAITQFDARYMIDDTNVFYNAYKTVFPSSRAQKILCSSHVSKTVQRRLNEALQPDDAKIGQRLFRDLFHQAVPTRFENLYAAFLTWLYLKEADEVVEVSSILERKRRKEWAPCYRRVAPFATSNHAESWHNTLKHNLLHDKQNSRLDNLVFTLVRYTADLELKLLAQALRNSSDGKGRRTQTLRRHRDAIVRYAERQGLIIPLRENTWGVVSKSQEQVLYTVYIGQLCSCDSTENSHCERCGVCYFQVSCDCPDSINAGVSCIHSHAVAIFATEARQLLPFVQHPHAISREVDSQSFDANEELPRDRSSEDPEDVASSSQEVPEEILSHDDANTEYQLLKGVESYFDEVARQCLQKGLVSAIRKPRIGMEQVLGNVTTVTGVRPQGIVRRTAVQGPGITAKPKPIVTFKNKRQVSAERKRGALVCSQEIDLHKVWDRVPRDSLIVCFICGKRQPPETSEDPII